jgi:hypothetical protein
MPLKDPTDIEKFVRWFVVPGQAIRSLPNGDGAFVALSVAFSLFERYYRIRTRTQSDDNNNNFKNLAAEELNVNREFFAVFWSTYRNGLLHQGSPKVYQNNNRKHKWLISGDFEGHPTYFDKRGIRYVCIDPWKFLDFIVGKILNDRRRIRGCLTYRLGRISDTDVKARQSVALAEVYHH